MAPPRKKHSKPKQRSLRKRRTREHVIADFSANHVNIPIQNVVDAAAVRRFEVFSDDVVNQQKGKIHHRVI